MKIYDQFLKSPRYICALAIGELRTFLREWGRGIPR